MNEDFCPRENDVVRAIREGIWNDELRAHVSRCLNCQEVESVSGWMTEMAGVASSQSQVPHPALVWIRAQLEEEQRRETQRIRKTALLQVGLLSALGIVAALLALNLNVVLSWLEPVLIMGPEVYVPSFIVLLGLPLGSLFVWRRWRGASVLSAVLLISMTGTSVIAQNLEVATSLSLTEGPTVDRDGNVYFSEIMTQRILKLGTDGILSVFRERSNLANGLVIDPQGRLIAAEGAPSATAQRNGIILSGKPRVTRTDLKTGKVEVLAEKYQGKPLVAPNDVTIDGNGRVYFTDMNGAAVYRIDAPGKLARILSAPEIERPNGIQISPDDRTLYLVEANGAQGGARMIRAYDLMPDGTVRNMRVFYNFYPGRSADGISIDVQGNLYASAGMHTPRGTAETLDTACGVYVISSEGKLLRFIPIPEDYITNNAFGGPDMKTLYVTAGKTLFKIRTDIAGLPR